MRYTLYVILALSVFSSCQENLDLNRIEGEEKLVVYSFPSTNDSIFIRVSKSLPTNSDKEQFFKIKEVKFAVNGKQEPVEYKGKGNDQLLSEVYYVTGRCNIGDTVDLEVSADDLASVHSSAVIPPKPEIVSTVVDTVFVKGKWFTQLRLEFKNVAYTAYFAVRVIGVEQTEISTREEIQSIDTENEPLLNGHSDADINFGNSNDYYHDMYIFDNSEIKDHTYTLHLNTPYRNYIPRYKIQLFRITGDYYRFLKSLNDIDNNDLSNYGVSLMTPTYTNIINGIGVMGSYNVVESPWVGEK